MLLENLDEREHGHSVETAAVDDEAARVRRLPLESRALRGGEVVEVQQKGPLAEDGALCMEPGMADRADDEVDLSEGVAQRLRSVEVDQAEVRPTLRSAARSRDAPAFVRERSREKAAQEPLRSDDQDASCHLCPPVGIGVGFSAAAPMRATRRRQPPLCSAI